MLVKSSTSRTLPMSRANSSSASLKVRYCVVSVIVATAISFSSLGSVVFEGLVEVVHLQGDTGCAGMGQPGFLAGSPVLGGLPGRRDRGLPGPVAWGADLRDGEEADGALQLL